MAQDIIFHRKALTAAEAHALPALTLAYIGDAVYELAVRDFLLSGGRVKNCDLHKTCTSYVSAPAQSELADRLLGTLDDDEARAYGRGRNAKLSVGKKSNPAVHCRATGFEAVLGFLYLTGRTDRLESLLSQILA